MNKPTGHGIFITFEGIDGAGKSSHIERTAQALAAAGREVVRTREPGGTALAETLRSLVLNDPMDALTESLLIFAARRDHLSQVILPALQRGAAVLCDRFTDSTFAYQGYGRGFDLEVLQHLEQWVQQGTQPDVTLWFDLPAEQAAKRLGPVRVPDRFESEPQGFFELVAKGYAARMQQFPQRFARIDASLSIEAVAEQVQQALCSRGIL
ncbi:dTMP kinase [Saezia sanguinis]|uniref:dTMP kinase n=1 Tax=Saezia sanguinis TaxID=1965230 RepID=UPI00303F2752